MTVVDPDLEAATVTAWHYERLRELGVMPTDAIRLSERTGIEWDALLGDLAELIRGKGCDPLIAVRIAE